MINLRIKNEETAFLNVEHHIVEVQLIPRAIYDHRNDTSLSYLNYVL